MPNESDIDSFLTLRRLVEVIVLSSMDITADTYGRAVEDVGVRPLACCDSGFESRRRHGCISRVLCVVRYRSMRRANHSSIGVRSSVMCLTETSTMRRPMPTMAV